MKKINNGIRAILLFTLLVKIDGCFGQDFYSDFLKYQDTHSMPYDGVSLSRLHAIHLQFASELKKLFDTVKRKTGHDMLNCDQIFILIRDSDYSTGGYSKLVWNNKYCCYYRNLHFSAAELFKNGPLKIETDARKRLLAIDTTLRRPIEHSDTAAFRKSLVAYNIWSGAGISFTIATKIGTHWRFFRSKTFGSPPPD